MTDSLKRAQKYEVLSISRLYLQEALKLTPEQAMRLTDEDMQHIADTIHENMLFVLDQCFDDEVLRILSRIL